MDKFTHFSIAMILVFGSMGFMGSSQAASTAELIQKGNALYDSGKYDEAITAYDEAAVEAPESPYIYYNKGTALYQKEDYAAARESFGQAAIKTKDIRLEKKSRFNTGLCFFREGERQKDSDLKKTLAAYEASIQSFQEALDLDSKFTEAAENIERVRLMMKSVLDELKKQEEAAKKQQQAQQQTAEKIKELIDKQKNLLEKSQSLSKDISVHGKKNAAIPKNKDIAEAQKQLKKETQDLSEQLAQQTAAAAQGTASGQTPPSATPPAHPSRQHLDASAYEQESAIENFSGNDLAGATPHQEKSLDELNKALEALNNGQKNSGNQQENAQKKQGDGSQAPKNGDPDKDRKQQQQNPQSDSDTKAQADKDAQQAAAAQRSEDADNILNEEKKNKKHREAFTPGGFKNVDKDW